VSAPPTIKYRGQVYRRAAALAPEARQVRRQLTKQLQLVTATKKFEPAAVLALAKAVEELLTNETLDETPHYAVARALEQSNLIRLLSAMVYAQQQLEREQENSLPKIVGSLRNILDAFPQ
jgi:hypothetical protein